MFWAATMKLKTGSSTMILSGLAAGAGCGLFFGDYCTLLSLALDGLRRRPTTLIHWNKAAEARTASGIEADEPSARAHRLVRRRGVAICAQV